MPESFVRGQPGRDVVVLGLWHRPLDALLPRGCSPKVPAFTVVPNQPILESECYPGVLVTLTGSIAQRISIFFSAACACLFSS